MNECISLKKNVGNHEIQMSMHKKKQSRVIDFQEYLFGQLKNTTVRKHYDEYGKQLEIAYEILQLRKKEKMSQASLLKR